MPAKFSSAPEVQKIAERLIREHHPDLAEAKIAYLFREGDWASGDKTILGKAAKLTGAHRYLMDMDFIITLNRDEWMNADPAMREYLIDHELCHCARAIDEYGHPAVDNEGRPKWRIVKHDLEEFADCVRRHGLITKDQRRFHEAANQLTIEDIVNETARTIKDMEKRGLKVTISGQGVA